MESKKGKILSFSLVFQSTPELRVLLHQQAPQTNRNSDTTGAEAWLQTIYRFWGRGLLFGISCSVVSIVLRTKYSLLVGEH